MTSRKLSGMAEEYADAFSEKRNDIEDIYITFVELLMNTMDHSRTGVGKSAQKLGLNQYPVHVYFCENFNRQTLLLQNFTDELRAKELMRRVSILKLGDRRLGPAQHIYKDDPEGHDGRGNGLRDIFNQADRVFYRVLKPWSGSPLRHVTALARFNMK